MANRNDFKPADAVEKETRLWFKNGAKFLAPFAITAFILKLLLGYIDGAVAPISNLIIGCLPAFLHNAAVRYVFDLLVLGFIAVGIGALCSWSPTRRALNLLKTGVEKIPGLKGIFKLIDKLMGGNNASAHTTAGVAVLIPYCGTPHLAVATGDLLIDGQLFVNCVIYSNPPTGWQVAQAAASDVRIIQDMSAGEVMTAGISMGTTLGELKTQPYTSNRT